MLLLLVASISNFVLCDVRYNIVCFSRLEIRVKSRQIDYVVVLVRYKINMTNDDKNRMRKSLLRSGPVYRVDHTIQGAKGSMIPRAYHSKLYKSRVISGPLGSSMAPSCVLQH